MKHLNKTTVRLTTLLVLLVMSMASVTVLSQAEFEFVEVPSTIGGFKIQPGGILEGVPSDFAPAPNACDNAAGSYVSPGVDAIHKTMIQFDEIVHDNKDADLVLYALYALEANEFGTSAHSLFNNPQDLTPVGNFPEGDVKVIGDESTCLTEGAMTVRLWELEDGTWAVDTISFSEAVDISDAWNANPSPQLNNVQFDLPVLVEGLVIRYLMPYIEPPITTVPGANTDQVAQPVPPMCEHTAPSNLNIGVDVMFTGYGYSQFPTNDEHGTSEWTSWVLGENHVGLGEYGSQVYNEIRNETPLTGIVGNLDSVMMSPQELHEGIKFGTIVDGPFCTASDVSEPITLNGIPESTIGDDRFYTWWKVDVNGTVGWYPEIVGQYSFWLWENYGMFDRKLTMYFMTPVNLSETQSDTCPATGFAAGQEVEPAIGAMNLRVEPNGDIMGRFEMAETVILSSGPVCEGGSNWWWTDRGFLAENDPETRTALLLPAVQKFDESATEETTEETVVTPQPSSQPDPEPTREPESDDDDKKDKKKDKDNDKDRDDDDDRRDTTTPSGDSSTRGGR